MDVKYYVGPVVLVVVSPSSHAWKFILRCVLLSVGKYGVLRIKRSCVAWTGAETVKIFGARGDVSALPLSGATIAATSFQRTMPQRKLLKNLANVP